MIWAFVDYENVGSLEALDLKKYQRLIIFCGPRHRKLNLGDIPTASFCHLELIRMTSTGNNNLDFHLAFYLGVHHLEAGNDVEFHVISNDKGFDGVIGHLSEMGRSCSRVNCVKKKLTTKAAQGIAKKATKKAVKQPVKTAVNEATKKVVKKATKKAAKKVVAKKALEKSAKATVKSAAAQAGREIVPTAVVPDQLKKIVEMLNACPVDSRPNKKEALINWITNRLNEDPSISGEIVGCLQQTQMISSTESGLEYHLPNDSKAPITESGASSVSASSSKEYLYSSLEIAQAIKSLGVNDRPRNLSVLEQWIMRKLDVDKSVARGIYRKLIREQCVLPEEDWISYSFDDAC